MRGGGGRGRGGNSLGTLILGKGKMLSNIKSRVGRECRVETSIILFLDASVHSVAAQNVLQIRIKLFLWMLICIHHLIKFRSRSSFSISSRFGSSFSF